MTDSTCDRAEADRVRLTTERDEAQEALARVEALAEALGQHALCLRDYASGCSVPRVSMIYNVEARHHEEHAEMIRAAIAGPTEEPSDG